MYRRHTANNGKVINRDMSSKRRIIRENTAIADGAVMRNVRIHHQ